MIKVLLLSFLMSSVSTDEVFHSEVVAEVRIDNFQNELFVEVLLDKRMLSTVLIIEADCQPQEMLSKCGSEYLQSKLKLVADGQELELVSPEMEIFQKQVMYRYYLGDLGGPVSKLEVSSDYMFDQHEHSIVKVKVGIGNTSKSFNLSASKRSIQTNII
ncbi:DUF6702 family protein [Marinoscillum pacificum]|uniref:DUF6702 family protein n=1 Tax=Marinoscillum pacificum TaxID=392723 RepID=UPI002157D696|nr:DUF6702 family protein [Marinoscillum pacificum]